MATTMKINNGDVVVSNVTGRPILIGNSLGVEDIAQSKLKTSQDMKGSLSISRIQSGAGAGISELVGTIDGPSTPITLLIKNRIRSMFTAILSLQRKRLNIRPQSERFDSITQLLVTPDVADRTSYRFRVDTKTVTGRTITQSGIIVP